MPSPPLLRSRHKAILVPGIERALEKGVCQSKRDGDVRFCPFCSLVLASPQMTLALIDTIVTVKGPWQRVVNDHLRARGHARRPPHCIKSAVTHPSVPLFRRHNDGRDWVSRGLGQVKCTVTGSCRTAGSKAHCVSASPRPELRGPTIFSV